MCKNSRDSIGRQRKFPELRRIARSFTTLKPLVGGPGFTGKAPGGPRRWSREDRNTEWFPLKHRLVCEVQYNYFSSGRFRHGTKFLGWRPDKDPEQCTVAQVQAFQPGAANHKALTSGLFPTS
jgi:ATP-dependent DNA ligase